jgi:glyoxylase-like metal-dependent hydrolase (beta-lactamase superfamily II)
VYPEELRALPEIVEQAGFPVSGLLATHGDWDHLLGRLAFGEASLGCPESTVARLAAEPGAAQRSLREFDDEHYVDRRVPLALGSLQSLPVPGRVELGGAQELELHPAEGHTADGAAYWLPWLDVLVCGDYLSPVEIPMLSAGGSLDAYRATLERLRALIEQAAWVVPGHGTPISAVTAAEILAQDDAYLAQLAQAPADAKLPPRVKGSATQRKIHHANQALQASGAS